MLSTTWSKLKHQINQQPLPVRRQSLLYCVMYGICEAEHEVRYLVRNRRENTIRSLFELGVSGMGKRHMNKFAIYGRAKETSMKYF